MQQPPTATILNVDDNEASRYVISHLLRQAGFTVIEATSGGEALHRVSVEKPALVVLDVRLPDLSGFEVCQRIKCDPALTATAVLQRSAVFTRTDDKVQGLEGGADAYLVEPVEPQELLATIKALLRTHRGDVLQSLQEELQSTEDELRQQHEELLTARQAAEQERQRYVELFQGAPDGYVVTDLYGAIQEVNRAAVGLLHRQPQCLVGQPLSLLIAAAERPAFYRLLARLASGEEVGEQEVTFEPAHGRPVPVALTVVAIQQPTGQVGGLRWLVRDITERKQAEAQLHELNAELERRVAERTAELSRANAALQQEIAERQRTEAALARHAEALRRSNEELQQFAYVASHDLQEPLRAVSTYVHLLAQRYQDRLGADAEEFMGYAMEGAQRMKALIDDLLRYSRVDMQGQEGRPTDSGAVWQRVLQDMQAAITERRAVITADSLPLVLANAIQLGQVLQNLLSNALKFCEATPPRIHLSAQREGDHWRFALRDNGIGIAPQHAQRIFAMFQRLHARGKYPGTGIGLAISKKIVERHGGRMWVESEPGAGSTFFFTLPLPP